MESQFVQLVRNSKVRQPTQRGFSVEAWKNDFNAIMAPSILDTNLVASGIWFHNRLNTIREKLREVSPNDINKEKLIRMYVGATNHFIKELQNHQQPQSTNVAFPEGNIEAFVPVSQISGAVENIIDSIRYPLGEAIRTNNINKDRKLSRDEVGQIISNNFSLGFAYNMLEYLWSECVWSNWYVDTNGEIDLVRPYDIEREIIQAISIYRRDSLLSEVMSYPVYNWQEIDPMTKLSILNKPQIIQIEQAQNSYRFVSGVSLKDTGLPPSRSVIQFAAQEVYFDTLLDIQLPKLANLTIRTLIDCWSYLSTLAPAIKAHIPNLAGLPGPDDLLLFSPAFNRGHIEQELSRSVGINRVQAKQALQLFTFSGTPREDMWFKPFIPVNNNQLTAITITLEFPNLLRSIDYWMKEGDILLNDRGAAFEAYVREEAIAESKLDNVQVHPINFEGKFGEEFEQIDLIIRLGNTLVIGEAKCSVYPVTPLDYFNYFATLQGATEQAMRKAQFVQKYLSEVIRALNWAPLRDEDAQVIPLVVSNNTLGTGMSFNNVPIVDLLILNRYFREGKIERHVLVNRDGSKRVGHEVVFYNNSAEAEVNLLQYLRLPPTIDALANFIGDQITPLTTFEDEKPAGFLYFRIVIPGNLTNPGMSV